MIAKSKFKKWLLHFVIASSSVLTILSGVAAFTPNPVDDGIIYALQQFLGIVKTDLESADQPSMGTPPVNTETKAKAIVN